MLNDESIIYHYCSVSVFQKIVETNTFWLSHARQTNDTNEGLLYVKLLESVASSFKKISNEELDVINSIVKIHKKRASFPYIGCFSTKGDLLSQWRAYGDDGQGVAIGFKVGKIPHFDLLNQPHGDCSGFPIVLDEINYSASKSEIDFLEKIISACLLIFRQTGDKEKAISAGVNGLDLFSIYSKNKDFEEEQEVRIAFFPCYCDLIANLCDCSKSTRQDIKFRTANGKLVSYFEYQLPPNAIQQIILGPKCMIDRNQLTLFLSRFSPDVRRKNNITKSSITYR